MQNIFELSWWFSRTPVRMSPVFEIGFFVLFAVMILGGLLLRIVKKTKENKYEREVFGRLARLCLTVGVVGLVWSFFSFEEIQIFGSRFWLLLIVIWVVSWLISIYRYWTIEVPDMRVREQSKAEANQYLPRRAR